VYEAVGRVRAALPADKALIGFAGGPWTVATYMIQGEGGDKAPSRRITYERPEDVDRLLAAIVEATAQHMAAQVKAGVQVLKIFESWAGGLSPALFERVVIRPNAALVRRLRELGVIVPIIGFPREAGSQIQAYAQAVDVDGLALDTGADARWVRGSVGQVVALQGNLDPMLLIAGGDALKRGVDDVLEQFSRGPHIFNLGHGITPDASIAHVETLVRLVKG
jgi:uroporphyrinogen decarboxylase